MPHSLHDAVEETVYETLRQGLYGWPVTDCTVTLTHSGYWPRQSHSHATFDPRMSSTASDFRNLTPLVLMSALKRVGTHVSEPIDRFHLEFPTDTLGTTLAALARRAPFLKRRRAATMRWRHRCMSGSSDRQFL